MAERGRIPVGLTLLGLSALPSDHPLNVGMLGMHGSYGANLLTNEADVILAVGMRFDDRVTGNLDTYARQARIIHIDVDPAEINKAVPVEVPIAADARAALSVLASRLRGPEPDREARAGWLARFREHDAIEHEAVIDAELGGTGPRDPDGRGGARPHPGEPRRGDHRERRRAAPDARRPLLSVRPPPQPHHLRRSRHDGFRPPGPPSGRSSAPRNARVVAVIGDGGFQMTLQELGTVMQERLPVKILILDNACLGMVRQWQSLFFDGRYSQVRLANPDFTRIAGAYGIPAERISERAHLAGALDRLLAADGPRLLAVAVGREDDVFPMIPAGAGIADMRLT